MNIKMGWENYYKQLVEYLYQPSDPSSLGIVRFLFGFLMLLDLPEERGGAELDLRWGDPRDCHFPLFSFIKPLAYPYMALLYGAMWFGAVGIMLGYKFRISVLLFGLPYWYLFLLDKSYWNNHSYLFGIVTILLLGSSANYYFSLDGMINKSHNYHQIPFWNYFIFRFQFFLMYFYAGLKKTDMDWLEGYSVMNLGSHWVFYPFTFFLEKDDIDYFVVHWFGFIFDLTVGFGLLVSATRPFAMVFCACFNLMNSRLFSIGMFPYVCVSTMPIFCADNWPKKLMRFFFINKNQVMKNDDLKQNLSTNIKWTRKIFVGFLLAHCGLQLFLPYSHFITKGYNNWTKGLYGYSWDMMVHSWDTSLIVIKVVDNNSGHEFFLDPMAWTQNSRWSKHGDMCIQYAQCLKKNLLDDLDRSQFQPDQPKSKHITSRNISIFIDVWCSLNGRFQQRMFDPNYDLLKASWTPFTPIEWLKPVLTEYNDLRHQINKITKEVYSWSNFSDVLFIADFPGLYLENFIMEEFSNVSLTVMEGEVVLEIDSQNINDTITFHLEKGDSIPINPGSFHKVHTVGNSPSCYVYSYVNKTKERSYTVPTYLESGKELDSELSFIESLRYRAKAFQLMVYHISNSFLHVVYDLPLTRRVRSPPASSN